MHAWKMRTARICALPVLILVASAVSYDNVYRLAVDCASPERWVSRFCRVGAIGEDGRMKLLARARAACTKRGPSARHMVIPVTINFTPITVRFTDEYGAEQAASINSLDSDVAVQQAEEACVRNGLARGKEPCNALVAHVLERVSAARRRQKRLGQLPPPGELEGNDIGVHDRGGSGQGGGGGGGAAALHDTLHTGVSRVFADIRASHNSTDGTGNGRGLRITPDANDRDIRLKHCRHGLFLYPAGEAIGQALDLFGEWDEQCVTLFDMLLQRGDTVLDIGAHIGTYTVFFAKRVGPHGRVLAIEPQRLVHQLLNANVALNALDNVWTKHAAAGGRETEGNVVSLGHFEAIEPGMFSLKNFQFRTGRLARFNESVEMLSVDGLFESEAEAGRTGTHGHDIDGAGDDHEPGDRRSGLHLVKADVEGFEVEVLRGAQNTVAQHRPLLYLEHNGHSGDAGELEDTELVRLLRGWNYTITMHRFFTRLSRHQGGDYAESNILCVPNERMHEEHIRTAYRWLAGEQRKFMASVPLKAATAEVPNTKK